MQVKDEGHAYELANVGEGSQTLQFIRKEEQDGKLVTVTDGTTNEEVLEALIDRTRYLDAQMPSDFNKEALSHLMDALTAFQNRTADRKAREVEGTNQA